MPATSMGLLLSAFFWTYGAFQLPAGWLIDRFGIRTSYFFGFLLWSLSSAAMSLSHGVRSMFALRLLLGVAESVGPLASLAFIRRAFSESERGLPVAAYIAGQTIGPACGALLGTTLLATAGWRTMFAVTGLGAMLWLPFWMYFVPREKRRRTEPKIPDANGGSWRLPPILRSPGFWAMSLCVFFFSYYWYFFLTWIPTYLNVARGLPMISMGRILSIPLFVMAPVNVAAGWLADRIISRGRDPLTVRLTLAASGFAGASLILVMNRVEGRAPILAVLIISVSCFGVASANFWTVVQHLAPAAVTARVIAYFNTLSQVAGAAAPLITGYTLGRTKNFSLAILLAGVSALCASGLLLIAGTPGVKQLRRRFEA